MAFHEVQFPTDISYGSLGGPEFRTEVITLASGFEKRNIQWTYPLERWQVGYGVTTQALLDLLRDFFYVRRGKAYGFRFKSPDDYSVTGQLIGTGDDTEDQFQLIKTYSSGGETLDRKITKPVAGSVSIYLDDVLEAGLSVDTTTGIVSFDSPAPSAGVLITADFEFDIPVRFDTDYLPVNLSAYLARAADVPVIEVRL